MTRILIFTMLVLIAVNCYAMKENDVLDNSALTNSMENVTTPDNVSTGGVVPGTEHKASETGNSDPTRNSQAMPSKATGM